MSARQLLLQRGTRTALAMVASVSLAVNLSCAPAATLPPLERSSAVQLKNPGVIVVRNTAGATSYPDVLTIYGVITSADEKSVQMEVRQLADPTGMRVATDVAGTTTVSRSDVRRIFESESEPRQRRPVIGLIALPVFVAGIAMALLFIYKGLTILL